MWLLSTDRAELSFFPRNFDATGGYAILSHTWVGKEQTFQEVLTIAEQCRRDGTNPRNFVHPKIRNCCIIAEKHGYRWVWIDSCCIDKRSSSELSEAINSMFRWYKEAEICFAYLTDVPEGCDLEADERAFKESRWHTRGWTLQELIAPDLLIFLSTDWCELGTRANLATILEKITQIPSKVLTGEHQPANYSVSIRMSWASKRKTTRVEDEAYCLMGLFGVNFPTNYGEGKNAFIRLQYEIMQNNPDMSLFAFGYRAYQKNKFTFHPEGKLTNPLKYLLADSPSRYNFPFAYIPDLGSNTKQQYPPIDSTLTGPFDDVVQLPRLSVTNYGVKLRVPIYEADGITIAVILCKPYKEEEGYFGLFLTRDSRGKDPERPRYFTGCVMTKPDKGSEEFVVRMADLGDDLYNLTFRGNPVKSSWCTIYVVPAASDLDFENSTTPILIMNCDPTSHFRIPRWLVARFTSLRFRVMQLENTRELRVLEMLLSGVVCIQVSFGLCTQHSDDPKNLELWAKVNVSQFRTEVRTYHHHKCPEDHLDSWSARGATRSKYFRDKAQPGKRGVQLSLTPCTRTPGSLFMVHLQLLGSVLEKTLQEAGAPSLLLSLEDLQRETQHVAPNDPVQSSRYLLQSFWSSMF